MPAASPRPGRACPSVRPSVRLSPSGSDSGLAAACVRHLPVQSASLSCEELMAVLGNGGARSARRPRLAGAGGRRGERAGRAPAAAGCGSARVLVPKQAPNCRFLGKGSDGTEGSVVLLRALGTLDAARFGTPRSRQLDGFNLFPLHFIFARLQAANCSPVAWPTSVLLHEPGFTRARLTPRCWDVMGEAGNLLSLPCWALHWAPGYLLASCRSLPLASSKSFFWKVQVI